MTEPGSLSEDNLHAPIYSESEFVRAVQAWDAVLAKYPSPSPADLFGRMLQMIDVLNVIDLGDVNDVGTLAAAVYAAAQHGGERFRARSIGVSFREACDLYGERLPLFRTYDEIIGTLCAYVLASASFITPGPEYVPGLFDCFACIGAAARKAFVTVLEYHERGVDLTTTRSL